MEQEKIWNFFQNDKAVGKSAFHADMRHRYLAARIHHGARTLNIGVGRGSLERLLVKNGVQTYSLDPNIESIQALREELNLGDRASVGYSQDLPFENNSFDFVVMSEVLEHLTDSVLAETVKECHRVLRVGGAFIGTVPANENLADGITVCPCCGTVFHRWGHVQEFTSSRLTSVLTKDFPSCTVRRKFFGDWNGLNWKGKITHVVRKALSTLGIHGSGENLYFFARK